MPSRLRFTLALLLAFAISDAAVLASSRTASAQPGEPPTVAQTTEEAGGYAYRFHDDPLAAGGVSPTDARLRVVPHAARNVLIRPRVQFVAEMLKSVENL